MLGNCHKKKQTPTLSRRNFLLGTLGLGLIQQSGRAAPQAQNSNLIRLIRGMPKGGGYDASRAGTLAMARATEPSKNGLILRPELAKPSYCSGATYLLLLRHLEESGYLRSRSLANLLAISDVADGEGAWGRWNANGPGAARFCHSTGIGVSFEEWEKSAPGDFMKIFWNGHIGKNERGHLVLLTDRGGGKDPWVKTWSSHEKAGYGFKKYPLTKIKWAIFTRIQNPEKIRRLSRLPPKDKFLAGLLTKESSRAEVRRMCGMGLTP